jgi:hypothetical protein
MTSVSAPGLNGIKILIGFVGQGSCAKTEVGAHRKENSNPKTKIAFFMAFPLIVF